MEVTSVNNDYSSALRRLGAFFIDRIALSAILSIVLWRWWGWSFYPLDFDDDYSFFNVAFIFSTQHLLSEIIILLYFSVMESSKYQATLGKIVLGIKVVNNYHQRISFPKALLRNLSKYLSAFILCIGYIMIIFDDRKQGLHDKIADTFVVKN